MHREKLVMVCCSDIAGQVRGKGFPAQDLKSRLLKGVGWTPTNLMITALGPIADTPWGPFGDLVLIPDTNAEVNVDFGDDSAPEHFFLADIRNTNGTPWDCCPRQFLKRALEDLRQETGLQLLSAFEHEFFYTGVEPQANSAYNLEAFRRQGLFAEVLMQALRNAGVEPETFMAEYGPCQYELTCDPAVGLQAADRAVIVRELTRATAHRLGHRASFSPILDPNSVGNGVHIHLSLLDEDEQPVTYDPQHRYGLSSVAGHFIAGILRHLPALCALTAASVISYLRLTPNRWSASYNNLGYRDREASVRICPPLEWSDTARPAHQFNVEYRAADAAASPYLVLGAIVYAGLQGLREKLPMPEPTEQNLETLSPEELQKRGIQRLPQSLEAALQALENTPEAKHWLGEPLLDAYLRHKRSEIEILQDLEPEELCARYREVY